MAKTAKILGIIVILSLFILAGAPFLANTGLAIAQDSSPKKGTTGELTVKETTLVLDIPLESKVVEPAQAGVLQTGWQTIMTEGFEGGFPDGWSVGAVPYSLDPYIYCDAYWGKDNNKDLSGLYSAFCAKSGNDGVDPPDHYPNYMYAYMAWGPFSLTDTNDAKLDFYLWSQIETGYDSFSYLASTDGYYWGGYLLDGSTSGWESVSFDLTAVPFKTDGFTEYVNLCGQSQVYIMFLFTSDFSITYDGAFVDDISLQKFVTVEPTWTFMAYLDGDNNIEPEYIYNFNYMEMAADNPNVNIIVQFDRIPGYDSSNGDWTNTRRYKVKHDTDEENFASYTLDEDYWNLPELNMADPNTLIEFVEWAKTEYPADHYCLALDNHGSGWKPTGLGQLVPTGILWDYTDGYYMSIAGLGDALNSATSGGTEKLDVLFLDACQMQMIEVGYEVRNYSQYLVASEYWGWAPGPYYQYISSITSTTTAEELATTIVDEYHSWLTGSMNAHTMSAVDLSQYGLASVVDDFAQALTTGLSTYRTEIGNQRDACQEFDRDSYIDLYHFAYLINDNIDYPTIQTAAQAVMTGVDNAIITEEHENGFSTQEYLLDNAHGISIYFPASESDDYYSNYNSDNLEFVADKGWDEFLAAFFNPEVEIQLSLKAGWNMVSVPVVPQDTSVASVFAGTEVVYAWDPVAKSYYPPTNVEPDKGYWVAVLSDMDIFVTGVPVYVWTSDITAGWNMIGSVIDTVDFTDPQDNPNGSVEAFAYWWDPVTKYYDFVTTIEPKKGYWIAATQNCTLTMSAP